MLRLENGRRLGVERWPLLESKGEPVAADTARFERTDTPLGRISKKLFRPRGEDERELTLPELYAEVNSPPSGTTSSAMWAELHRRVINIVAMLLLPVLAIPFAIGRARSPRAYRMIMAMALLIAFHEIIEQGAVMAKAGTLSPLLVLWLPTLVLAAFALWRFYKVSFTILDDSMDSVYASFHDSVVRLLRRLWPRLLPWTGGRQ
jgi:lipopolysaccharide export system permease protein